MTPVSIATTCLLLWPKCCWLEVVDDTLSFSGRQCCFNDAIHVHPKVQAVADYMLQNLVTLVSLLPLSKLFTPLPLPVKHLWKMLQDLHAHGASVVLCSLLTNAGLVNRAVQAICYHHECISLPSLPMAVMLKLDKSKSCLMCLNYPITTYIGWRDCSKLQSSSNLLS